ncbi:hypothetical protein TIFTF001_009955 [Ficus carica]|uniref:Uncharacterized protein n=1 Tax=Ficus carica TaxID=3494 RepID=A0AA87ZW63_FICCA|nr:hypothetical protein TIFTF001_009955 [Ficus carica]
MSNEDSIFMIARGRGINNEVCFALTPSSRGYSPKGEVELSQAGEELIMSPQCSTPKTLWTRQSDSLTESRELWDLN